MSYYRFVAIARWLFCFLSLYKLTSSIAHSFLAYMKYFPLKYSLVTIPLGSSALDDLRRDMEMLNLYISFQKNLGEAQFSSTGLNQPSWSLI